MKTLLFCTLFIPQVVFSATIPESGNRSLFSYTEKIGLPSQVLIRDDVLVLKDGTLFVGSLEKGPELLYSFGKVPLDIDTLELISKAEENPGKWMAKTTNGSFYIAPLFANFFNFQVMISDSQGFVSKELRSIAAKDVNFILLKPRGGKEFKSQFQLKFANDDILPIDIVDRKIDLVNGKINGALDVKEIISLKVEQGEIRGEYIGEEGKKMQVRGSQAANATLTVMTSHHKGTLRIPFRNIGALSRNMQGDSSKSLASNSAGEKWDEPEERLKTAKGLIPDIAFQNEFNLFFPSGLDFTIAEVDFIQEPRFASLEELVLPHVSFMEESRFSFLDENQFLAMGEDFVLTQDGKWPGQKENGKNEKGRDAESSDSIQFISGRSELDESRFLALGEDFVLTQDGKWPGGKENVKGEKGKEAETSDSIQFISDSQSETGPVFRSSDIKKGREFIALADYSYQGAVHSKQSREMQGKIGEAKDSLKASSLNTMASEASSSLQNIKTHEKSQKATPLKNHGRDKELAAKIETTYAKKINESVNPYEGMVYIKQMDKNGRTGFYIQSKKVTNREYKKFVEAVNYKSPAHWIKGEIPPNLDDSPVVNVTYKDAFLYAVWLGKRLPSEQELAIAWEEPLGLADKADGVDEWTRTPFVSVETPVGQASKSAKIGAFITSEHVIFGTSLPEPMRNQEFNSRTGFRLAANAQ